MDKTRIITRQHAPAIQVCAQVLRRQMTPAETLLWQRLRNKRLGGLHFRRQQAIDDFLADFYCHAAGLIVEADGASHKDRAEYDRLRDHIISERGFCILRFSNDRIENDLEGVLEEILHVARERLHSQYKPQSENKEQRHKRATPPSQREHAFSFERFREGGRGG